MLKFSFDALRYEGFALEPVEQSVAAGELLVLLGPSGSGKSSLLNWIAGFSKATVINGKIQLNADSIEGLSPQHRGLGWVQQRPLLFPHLSVGQNIGFALKRDAHYAAKVKAALVDAELVGFEERDPASLSGGQQARVALLRCLLSQPRALLMDEPFSALDPALTTRFAQWLWARVALSPIPVLMVTHDPSDIPSHVKSKILEF